jgi:hypothetical protein
MVGAGETVVKHIVFTSHYRFSKVILPATAGDSFRFHSDGIGCHYVRRKGVQLTQLIGKEGGDRPSNQAHSLFRDPRNLNNSIT